MTEFNNFNLEKEENISAEESKISSAEGAFEQEDELSFKRALETQEKTADVENIEQFEGEYINVPEEKSKLNAEVQKRSFTSRYRTRFDPVVFELQACKNMV